EHLRTLINALPGDLDWIVMKCLEKNRNRRYETANGLAADIQGHLNNELVLARPPSAGYRFQKFVRRNKVQFGAAAFAVASLIVAVTVSSWQALKAKRAEQIAKNEAEEARTVKDFITQELLGRLNPFLAPGFNPNNRVLIEGIAQAVEGRFQNQ